MSNEKIAINNEQLTMNKDTVRKPKTFTGKVFYLLFVICYLLFAFSCSSAPKKPAEIFTERNVAASQLNLANQTANRGSYDEALLLLAEARRLALSTDDPQLRIKTSMARGNILFSMGRQDEAFKELENAAAEGDTSNETILTSLVRIYIIRAQLRLQEELSMNSGTAINELIDKLNREINAVRSDPLASAAGYVTLGMAERLAGRWAEAESAVKKALDIHDKGLHLEDAAYDWFLIGSIRSMAGKYDSSIEALKQSISLDRRAENGFGLASSWQALGDVYQKAGKTGESRSAYQRAAEIFRAIGFIERAEKLEGQIR